MDINSLERFVKAQENMYQIALIEIQRGYKVSHWMWYIFPQIRGLGSSRSSYVYGISGLNEAKEYLNHPLLYQRLCEICNALLVHKNKSAYRIFGSIDSMKLHSSMTLFALVSEEGSVFHQVIDMFYGGKMDSATLDIVNSQK